MNERVIYVCPACGYEGRIWFRRNHKLACLDCNAPLASALASRDLPEERTVFWKRPDGSYTLPGRDDARMPPEYERVEPGSLRETDAIVRAIDAEHRTQWERAQEGKDRLCQLDQSERRRELRSRMQHMAPVTRDFAQFAMDKNNSRPRPRYTGAFFLQAREFEKSNREPYRPDPERGR